MEPSDQVQELTQLMARLRSATGCPWDREQTHASLKKYLVEEAAELLDAIDDGDDARLADELGDVLLQVVFHCQLAAEARRFDLQDVARHLNDKLRRRHPHVFGDAEVKTAEEQTRVWEELKARERAEKLGDGATPSALDGVALGLPALLRAQKLVRRARRADLDVDASSLDATWNAFRSTRSAESLGALLLALAVDASELGVDAEIALREATGRFEVEMRRREKPE